MPKKESLPPGHYRRDFTARVELVTGKERLGDDGTSVDGGLSLTQEIIYHGVLRRIEGRFRLLVEWVDVDGNGHRFAVPHEVVIAIKNVTDRILKDSRSDRAKHGAETRAYKREQAENDEDER
jgi:hypothetical protein